MTSEASRGRYYILTLLTAAYALAQIDRQIIGILIESIKLEFQLRDAQLGLLNTAFSLAYLALCLPLAALADRRDRRKVLATCVAIWSGLTAACGAAGSYLQLLLLRAGVGAGEAGGYPIALAMVSDTFPPERRSSAVGIFSTGTNIGALIAFAVGGWVAAQFGWRAAFLVVGLPGLVLAVLILSTMPATQRPVAPGTPDRDAPNLRRVARDLIARPATRWLLCGVLFFSMPYTAITIWLAPFLSRSHELPLSITGPVQGLIIGVIGALGAVIGGLVADRVNRLGLRWVPPYLAATYLAVGVFALLALTAGDARAALAAIAAWSFSSGFGAGPKYALIHGVVDPRRRALVSAVIALLLNLSFALGPQLVGNLSDAFSAAGGESLRQALIVVTGFYVLAALVTVLATRTIVYESANAGVQPL